MKENYFAPNMKKNRNNTQGKYIACTRKKNYKTSRIMRSMYMSKELFDSLK